MRLHRITDLMFLNINWSIESDFHKSTKVCFSSEMRVRQTRTIAIELGVQDFGIRRLGISDVSPEAICL